MFKFGNQSENIGHQKLCFVEMTLKCKKNTLRIRQFPTNDNGMRLENGIEVCVPNVCQVCQNYQNLIELFQLKLTNLYRESNSNKRI